MGVLSYFLCAVWDFLTKSHIFCQQEKQTIACFEVADVYSFEGGTHSSRGWTGLGFGSAILNFKKAELV